MPTSGSDASEEQPIANIVGELVALGPLRRDLLPVYYRWINDFGATRNLGMMRPMTLDQETSWYEGVVESNTDIVFTIYERATMTAIGTTSLMDLNHRNRTAEFGIFIGEAAYRGKGYGTETTRLMLEYAFSWLGLHNVMLRVFEFNEAGLRAYQKAGFREFGRRRQAYQADGRLWDDIYMECLAGEFRALMASTTRTTEGV